MRLLYFSFYPYLSFQLVFLNIVNYYFVQYENKFEIPALRASNGRICRERTVFTRISQRRVAHGKRYCYVTGFRIIATHFFSHESETLRVQRILQFIEHTRNWINIYLVLIFLILNCDICVPSLNKIYNASMEINY